MARNIIKEKQLVGLEMLMLQSYFYGGEYNTVIIFNLSFKLH